MSPLTTEQKGQIAFLKVQIEAARKGAIIAPPTTPARHDLILDYRGKLYRVQVKYADSKSSTSVGAVRVDLRKRKRCYSQEEIDVILVYVPQVDKVCWFTPEAFHNKVGLQPRLHPAKNGQRRGCRLV